MGLWQFLLKPLSLIYGQAVSLRYWIYYTNKIPSFYFEDVAVISVGNLSMGGTGKTPMIEYLLALQIPENRTAVVSSGYRRSTSGMIPVQIYSRIRDVGDEALMVKRNFPQTRVLVTDSRYHGIRLFKADRPDTVAVILDDAFQYLTVKPSLNILLTDYSRMFYDDYLFPAGRLREWRGAYGRADVIVVTKCPGNLAAAERDDIIGKLAPLHYQRVYFSFLEYLDVYDFLDPDRMIRLGPEHTVLLVCGIANPSSLFRYLQSRVKQVHSLTYRDHKHFGQKEILQIMQRFNAIRDSNKIIITTEKDAVRLVRHTSWIIKNALPVYVQPVWIDFGDDREAFHREIAGHLKPYQKDIKAIRLR